MGLDVSDMKYKLYTAASGFDTNQVTGTYGTLKIGRLDVTTDGGAQGAIDAEGDVNVEGTVHASSYELDASPSFTQGHMGNEFNSHMRKAIEKHALPIQSVILWDGGSSIPNGYVECNGGTYTCRDGVSREVPDFRGYFPVGYGGSGAPTPQGHWYHTGGSVSKSTGDATNALTLAVDLSQFTIDDTSLVVGQIPQHVHGISHGHSGVTINSFTSNGGSITVNTSGNGAHDHSVNDPKHSHNIRGGGTSDDGGPGVPGSNSDGNQTTKGENTGVTVVAGEGTHNHSVDITRDNIVASISSATGSVDEGTLTPDSTSGEGSNHGLKNPADGHTHTTSGSIAITNRSHTHTIDDITPPWIAIRFMYKL